MSLIAPLVDYTDKDFTALEKRLRNLVTSVYPEWTDFNVANFGNLLLELFAHVGDILIFYQDAQARQSRITSATQRKALLGLVKLIGFTPTTASAATANVTITLPAPTLGDVLFPAGTIVKTEEITSPTKYQLLEDTLLPAGSTSIVAVAENSETRTDRFIFNSQPNQKIALSATPYIDGTAVVTASNGIYTRVDNFLDSTATDMHYVVEVDQGDKATLKFGNGVNGASPSGTGDVVYRIGGGADGRVEMNKLRLFEQTVWLDALGNSVTPNVTNPLASQGGADRQSVAQIKERAPASLRALTRSVAREDFEINALRIPQVARALMMTKNEDPSIEENAGELYVIPTGGGLPTEELKARVLNQVTVVYPCTLTFRVSVKDPVYRVINPSMIVYFSNGVVPADVAARIRENLQSFFAVENEDGTENTEVNFGGKIVDTNGTVVSELALSDVFNAARDTTGVRKMPVSDFLLNDANQDVVLLRREFPSLGVVTIVNGDTGAVL